MASPNEVTLTGPHPKAQLKRYEALHYIDQSECNDDDESDDESPIKVQNTQNGFFEVVVSDEDKTYILRKSIAECIKEAQTHKPLTRQYGEHKWEYATTKAKENKSVEIESVEIVGVDEYNKVFSAVGPNGEILEVNYSYNDPLKRLKDEYDSYLDQLAKDLNDGLSLESCLSCSNHESDDDKSDKDLNNGLSLDSCPNHESDNDPLKLNEECLFNFVNVDLSKDDLKEVLTNGNSQDIANTMWAYATLGYNKDDDYEKFKEDYKELCEHLKR